MRTIAKYDEVAHWWANRTQDEGRTPGGRMFFHGAELFSYGSHYMIARHAAPGVVLFNGNGSSVTTEKQKRVVRAAARHLTVFEVPNVKASTGEEHAANVTAWLATVEEAKGQALRALTRGEEHKRRAEWAATQAVRYVNVRAFGKLLPARLRDEVRRVHKLAQSGRLFSAAELARIAASAERARVAEEKREAAAELRRRAWREGTPEYAARVAAEELARDEREAWAEYRRREAPGMLERWAAGQSNELPGWEACQELPTRVRLNGRRIETSRGAQITLRRAVELWQLLTTGGDPVGQELDGYRVDAWDGVTLTVGCHELAAAELARMARVLELPGQLPAGPRVA